VTIVRYRESRERSAEVLRQSLPLMARQAAALHPVSYAVWYEYVTQENPPLRTAVDAELARSGVLDEASTAALHHRHIAQVDEEQSRRVAEGFDSVLSGIDRSAKEAGDQTARFESSLTRLDSDLSRGLLASLDDALAETRLTRASMQMLQQRLAESRREVEALREQVHRATHDALMDSLTGLGNRRAFDCELAARLKANRDAGEPDDLCLLVIDVDHFKRINDAHGHSVGDMVLRALGSIFREAVTAPAFAARVGGEEFAVLLPSAPLAEAARFAEELRAKVAASRLRRKNEPTVVGSVTVSFGVTEYRRGETEEDFFHRADEALYAAKQSGRNKVSVLRSSADPSGLPSATPG
jgi:diguanylate cyclase